MVASWFITQEVAGSNTPFLQKYFFFKFYRFYRIHLGKTLLLPQGPLTPAIKIAVNYCLNSSVHAKVYQISSVNAPTLVQHNVNAETESVYASERPFGWSWKVFQHHSRNQNIFLLI